MQREAVYAAIDGERTYQQERWGPKGSARDKQGGPGQTETHWVDGDMQAVSHGVGNWIVFMEHYLQLAKEELTIRDGHTDALHMLRKVVALGVACFEQHGCPRRAGY